MKLKGQSSKLKSVERSRAVNTAVIAAFFAVMFHGILFSIPAYLVYANSKVKSQKSKVEQKNRVIIVDLAVLPAIKITGEKSLIKESEGKKTSVNNFDMGLNGPAEKQGSADAEKEMLAYRDIIKQKIQQARKYPAEARKNSIEGGVEVVFTVSRPGGLKTVEVAGASGNGYLDDEAVATVKRAAPFPEIPAGFTEKEMTMKVRIIFNIE